MVGRYLGILIAGILAVGAVLPAAAAVKSPHCYQSCPAALVGDQGVVRHRAFTLAPGPETKIAQWVAYKITAATLGDARPRRWRADPSLPDADVLEPADYRGAARAGYDRGHLAPLASLAGNAGWAETNYSSNLAPQLRSLNRGSWARQEAAERRLITKDGYRAVYVVVRPLYERPMPPLPNADESHRVPSGFIKTIIAVKDDHVWRASVRFDQRPDLLAAVPAAHFRK